jgi:hypothetical protein
VNATDIASSAIKCGEATGRSHLSTKERKIEKSKKKVPTYTCLQWNGDNLQEFLDEYDHNVTEWGGVLEISEWVQKFKGFTTHRVNLSEWAVRNDLTKKIKVLDKWDYEEQYEPV